jgi:hypothetical protein
MTAGVFVVDNLVASRDLSDANAVRPETDVDEHELGLGGPNTVVQLPK